MKRVLLLIALFFSSLPALGGVVFATDCTGAGENVSDCLNQNASAMKSGWAITLGDYQIENGVRKKIISVTNKIITITSLISVGAIVFAGFLMVTAYGEDETVKKGKNSLKWGIGGLLVGLLSFAVVNAVVNFFYGVGG